MNCLNCQGEVDSETAKLSNKVLVCRNCHALASEFTAEILQDIRLMHEALGDYLRAMLRTGSFRPGALRGKEARIGSLVRWMEGVRCPSPSTPILPPPTPSSGEPLPPHVATLAAIGQRPSNSPTE